MVGRVSRDKAVGVRPLNSVASHHVETSRLRLSFIGVLGLLVPLWWTWVVGILIYGFFVLGGSPERPSLDFARAMILVPSVIVGILGGGVVTALLPSAPLRGWVVFAICAVLGTAGSLLVLESIDVLSKLAQDLGTWAFAAGTLVVPVAARLARKRDG